MNWQKRKHVPIVFPTPVILSGVYMKKFSFSLILFSFLCSGIIAPMLFAAGLRDRLEGLVYEVEDWTEPDNAWLTNKTAPDKWCLWTSEPNVIEKRSNGASLKTPVIKKDRKSPEEGAPPLHTKITGIPNGVYKVYTGLGPRPLTLSFDGKEWFANKQEFLGIFQIDNGTFELWADDRYACPDNIGPAYYDYIRFVKTEEPRLTDLTAFTLPDGSTQLSWISSMPMPPAVIRYGLEDQLTQKEEEKLEFMRNHAVVLKGLVKGKKYTAKISVASGARKEAFSISCQFAAGEVPTPPATAEQKIPLTVSELTDSARQNWPVTSGVPFAQGKLASADDIQITDDRGKVIPAQFDVTSRWHDGSIKWITCDFAADTKTDGSTAVYYLVTGRNLKKTAGNGAYEKLKIKAVEVLKQCVSTIVLADGQTLRSQMSKPEVETAGPIRVSVKAEGDYLKTDKSPLFRWRCHVTAFNSGLVRVRWTIGNNKIDQVTTSVQRADWSLASNKLSGAPVLSDGSAAKKDLVIVQDLEKHASVTIDGKKTDRERIDGFFVCGDTAIKASSFWQTWPKGFTFHKDQFRFDILPALPTANYPPKGWDTPSELFEHFYWYKNGNYLFKRGLEICSEVWLATDKALVQNGKKLNAWLEHPLFAAAPCKYYCETKAFGNINPKRPGKFETYEKAFEDSFANLEKGRQKRGEYGWMNFGDWFGERSWNWGNNEYDLSYLMAEQFARTGNTAYIKRGLEMAEHYTTVDFCAYHWKKNARELVYAHSTGHVGGFIEQGDPRIADLKKFVANLKGGQDASGGHAFHPGNYLMGCLTGEKRILEVAQIACWNQATWYTPSYRISIERAAGWALSNAVYSYNFTNNPFYLNAAKIYYEVIAETQNPVTGCFDLRQDQTECDCPDKKEHRGGKAFAVGVLLHALARYYETSNDPKVKETIVRCADWLLDYSWNEAKNGFRYKTGCPKYADSGRYSIIVSEGIAFATEVSGNPRYIDFLDRTAGKFIVQPTGSGSGSGKSFSQYQRHLPHLLYYLEKHGKTAGVK